METMKIVRTGTLLLAIPLLIASCNNQQKQQVVQTSSTDTGYDFVNGYPTAA